MADRGWDRPCRSRLLFTEGKGMALGLSYKTAKKRVFNANRTVANTGGNRVRGSSTAVSRSSTSTSSSSGRLALPPDQRQQLEVALTQARQRLGLAQNQVQSRLGQVSQQTSALAGDILGRFQAALRKVESGGNYGAVGPRTPYGQATGGYQYLDSTWDGLDGQRGNGYLGFRQARQAPADVQDRVTRQQFEKLYRQFNGDLRKVAMYWHGGPNQRLWGPKTRAYANKVLGLMGRGSSW